MMLEAMTDMPEAIGTHIGKNSYASQAVGGTHSYSPPPTMSQVVGGTGFSSRTPTTGQSVGWSRYSPPQTISADKQLAGMAQGDWNLFNHYSKPMLDKLVEGIGDTSIIDRAYAQVDGNLENTQAKLERSLGRRTRGMSAAQQKAMSDQLASNVALGNTATINKAHIDQRDVNQQAAAQAMNAANALGNMGMQATSNAAGAQNARAQAAAQAKGSALGSFLQLAGTVVGGVVGGPAGAMIGGAIGGAVGGAR